MPFDVDALMTDAAKGNLAAGPPPAAPSYPIVPVHPAPDGSGAMTNLSDEHYAKFMKNEPPPPAPAPAPAQAAPTPPTPFDPDAVMSQASQGKLPAPAEKPAEAAPAEPFSATQQAGSAAAIFNALPAGIFGSKLRDAIEATTQMPQRMLYGNVPGPQEQGLYGPRQPQGFRFAGPSQAFKEGLAAQQQMNQTLGQRYPMADIGGQVTGGAIGGGMAAPSLGWGGLGSKAGNVASYLARNAGFGGAMSTLSGGDPMAGAGIGAAIPAAHVMGVAASPVTSLAKWPFQQLPQVFSSGAQQSAVGRTLAGRVGASPIESSSVGPLSLAQATNNPTVAAYGDVAPSFNAGANASLLKAQQDAVNAQIAKIALPRQSPDAASRLTNTIRSAEALGDKQEHALWNVPDLAQTTIPTRFLKADMAGAAKTLAPGLRLGISGNIRKAMGLLQSMPDHATVGEINSVRTALRLAGRPTESNPWAPAVSNQLQTTFLDSMDRQLNAATVSPSVKQAWTTARDFTRTLRTGPLATKAMQAATEEKNAASTASRGLFNFGYGSPEGPKSIADLAAFTSALNQPGAGALSADMTEAARSYLAAGMREAGRLGEGQNFNPKTLQDFIRTNSGWMRRSGILTGQQQAAIDDLSKYLNMLRRPEQLMRQVNSATQPRQARSATFIDTIMHPWARRLLELGGVVAGEAHSGGVGAMIGVAGGTAFEHAAVKAETTMRELMAQALLDTKTAQALMTKASPANYRLLSPQVRQALDTARLALGSDILPQFSAPSPTTGGGSPK